MAPAALRRKESFAVLNPWRRSVRLKDAMNTLLITLGFSLA